MSGQKLSQSGSGDSHHWSGPGCSNSFIYPARFSVTGFLGEIVLNCYIGGVYHAQKIFLTDYSFIIGNRWVFQKHDNQR
jgi:hypothetical protein